MRRGALALLALAGCAPRSGPGPAGPPPVAGAPRAAEARPGPVRWPAPPVARGALAVRVTYPAPEQLLTARDSNFILGSVGAGDATLRINGAIVPVHPSGTFLGWLPVPPDSAARYDIEVVRGADTVRRSVPVRLARRPRPLPVAGPLVVDSASLEPRGAWWLRPDERVRVALRAPATATVWVEAGDGRRLPMASLAAVRRLQQRAAAGGRVADADSARDEATTFATEVPATIVGALGGARVVAARGADTVRLDLARVTLLDTLQRRAVVLRSRDAAASDTDRVVVGRPVPAGTYRWFLLPGTIVEQTGRQGPWARVRLDRTLEIWVDADDVGELPAGTPLPRRVTGGVRVSPAAGWADVVIPVGDRPAFSVDQGDGTLVLTLHDVSASPEISPIIASEPLVRQLAWVQRQGDRAELTVRLGAPLLGYLVLWDEGRRALVLRLRRVPAIDPAAPLRGLTIAVDPGHPPAGATGPSGITEAQAVLPVGRLVARALEARGARVVLTRPDDAPVGLVERAVIARRADAHVFLSIHLNALPDGVNPFTANGTSTLFFHQLSEPLARAVQAELMARLGLRDLGIHYQNLAVARPTWYPSALAEGLFLMVPEQEWIVRTREGQQAYADGLVAGLERYLRGLAGGR